MIMPLILVAVIFYSPQVNPIKDMTFFKPLLQPTLPIPLSTIQIITSQPLAYGLLTDQEIRLLLSLMFLLLLTGIH
jgi:hypothetical protein